MNTILSLTCLLGALAVSYGYGLGAHNDGPSGFGHVVGHGGPGAISHHNQIRAGAHGGIISAPIAVAAPTLGHGAYGLGGHGLVGLSSDGHKHGDYAYGWGLESNGFHYTWGPEQRRPYH